MTDFDAVPALTDLEVPEPAEGEVRVRVRAASVNGFDLAVAAGYTKDYMEHRFPLPQVRAAAPDGVDAVAHLAGDASVAALVREGGRFASTLLQSPEQVPAETVTVIPVIANPTPETLARSAANQANGETTAAIQEIFSLEQLQAALNAFTQGTRGKVVITTD